MHSSRVGFIFLFLVCSAAALPCGGWTAGEAHVVGAITCPEEVILLTVSEEGESVDNVAEAYGVSTDGLNPPDHSLSGEVVKSAANEGVPQLPNTSSNPIPSESQEEPQPAAGKAEAEATNVHVEK